MTVIEKKGPIENLKIAWVGDGNNVANSWIQAAEIFGFELILACPEGYDPHPDILHQGRSKASKPIVLVRSPQQAVAEADIINVDVWTSMGQEGQEDDRLAAFRAFQVNRTLLAKAPPSAIVLHCLPAHRGEEITDAVLESEQCVAFDQAENKMHIHKAILEQLIAK